MAVDFKNNGRGGKIMEKLLKDNDQLRSYLDRIATTVIKHDKKLITTKQLKDEINEMIERYHELV